MKEQRLIIEIDREGRINANADGFSGDTCLQELEKLLDGLAPGTASVDRKPDAGKSRLSVERKQDLGRNQ